MADNNDQILSEKNINCYTDGEETQISLDQLKSDMAKYLQLENLSFLMGAGCSSKSNSSDTTGIPTMQELYNAFVSENPEFKIGDVMIADRFNKNLEKMLEVMGAVSVANQIQPIDSEINRNISTVQNFIRGKIAEGLKSDPIKELYKDFYSRIAQRQRKMPINVFTTNYDLFNEMALDELGFPYNNGFSGTYKRKFNPVSYNYVYVENMNLNHDAWDRVFSFFNLVKLHGSISWVRENEEIWERDYSNITEDQTVMIYPTPLKDRTTLMTPYSDLFRVMENRIVQKNSVLIVLGYSFSDDHINRIILNGLSVPSFRLVVFGSGKRIDELKKLKDSRIVIYDSDDKIQYFNNFVNSVLPCKHPDIEEQQKYQVSASVSIAKFEKAGE